jgi:hypothetical protein
MYLTMGGSSNKSFHLEMQRRSAGSDEQNDHIDHGSSASKRPQISNLMYDVVTPSRIFRCNTLSEMYPFEAVE